MTERYDFDLMDLRMVEDFDGQWVRYSDYTRLQEQLEAVTRERDEARARVARLEAALREARDIYWSDEAGDIAEAMFGVVNAALDVKEAG